MRNICARLQFEKCIHFFSARYFVSAYYYCYWMCECNVAAAAFNSRVAARSHTYMLHDRFRFKSFMHKYMYGMYLHAYVWSFVFNGLSWTVFYFFQVAHSSYYAAMSSLTTLFWSEHMRSSNLYIYLLFIMYLYIVYNIYIEQNNHFSLSICLV